MMTPRSSPARAQIPDNTLMHDQFDSLQIIGSRPSGGAERFYSRLAVALTDAGHRTLAVNQSGSSVSSEIGAAAPQHHVRMRGVWDPVARWQLANLTRRHRPAIVQTWMGRATRIYRRPRSVPVVHVARLGGYYDVAGYRHCDAWIGNTRGICDYLVAEGLRADRVFHLGNFVEPAPMASPATLAAERQRLGLAEDDLVVLFVGRLHANKGVPDLLDAFARLPTRLSDRRLRLLVVGDGGDRAALETQASQLDISERVLFTGWVADPGPCYALADLFVCSSVHEPLGNVVLEAWAHGTPVVSTRSQGPVEFMHDGVDGWMVPMRDPAALADAMRTALSASDAERRSMAEAGMAELLARHSRQAVTGDYLALYESLVP